MASLQGLAIWLLFPTIDAFAQAQGYLGVVERFRGKWDLIDSLGEKRHVEHYLSIPVGAKVRIVRAEGPAIGYLKIAMRDGTIFEACCDDLGECVRRNDCGEEIALPTRAGTSRLALVMDHVSQLLFSSPSRYVAPAIGGARNPGATSLILADGVIGAGNLREQLGRLIRREPAGGNSNDAAYSFVVSRVVNGKPEPPRVGAATQLQWDREGAAMPSMTLDQGLYQMDILKQEDGGLRDVNLNLWVLVVIPAMVAEFSTDFENASKAVKDLGGNRIDPDVAEAILRAYLHSLQLRMDARK